MRLLLVLLLAFALCETAAAEQIEIPLADVTLRAVLFKPDGPGPFPAVVALHGCEGLTDASGAIFAHYRAWGGWLATQGFAAIFPDSYGSRGYGAQCRVRERQVRASRGRIADANAARRFVQVQPWSNAERVSLIGWSHGAATALYVVRPREQVRDGTPDFRSVIAFYPNCGGRLGVTAWSGRIPALILIGANDDWTSANACAQMAANARGRSAQVQVVSYPGALHFFDRPDERRHELNGIANTANASGRVHVGTDTAARDDAFRRVREFLTR